MVLFFPLFLRTFPVCQAKLICNLGGGRLLGDLFECHAAQRNHQRDPGMPLPACMRSEIVAAYHGGLDEATAFFPPGTTFDMTETPEGLVVDVKLGDDHFHVPDTRLRLPPEWDWLRENQWLVVGRVTARRRSKRPHSSAH